MSIPEPTCHRTDVRRGPRVLARHSRVGPSQASTRAAGSSSFSTRTRPAPFASRPPRPLASPRPGRNAKKLAVDVRSGELRRALEGQAGRRRGGLPQHLREPRAGRREVRAHARAISAAGGRTSSRSSDGSRSSRCARSTSPAFSRISGGLVSPAGQRRASTCCSGRSSAHAMTRGLIGESPLKRLSKSERPTGKSKTKARTLTDVECGKLIARAPEGWRPMVAVDAGTGRGSPSCSGCGGKTSTSRRGCCTFACSSQSQPARSRRASCRSRRVRLLPPRLPRDRVVRPEATRPRCSRRETPSPSRSSSRRGMAGRFHSGMLAARLGARGTPLASTLRAPSRCRGMTFGTRRSHG